MRKEEGREDKKRKRKRDYKENEKRKKGLGESENVPACKQVRKKASLGESVRCKTVQ
jgi:hypothetical protein